MIYTTTPPRMCDTCERGAGARRETAILTMISQVLPGVGHIDGGYYSFLRSPKGYKLQLDRYYPSLKLAVEIDGRQHDTYNDYLQDSVEDFHYQQRCDAIKDDGCAAKGITLWRISSRTRVTPMWLYEQLAAFPLAEPKRKKPQAD